MKNKLNKLDAFNINKIVNSINTFNIEKGWRKKSDEIIAVLETHSPDLVPYFKNYLYGTLIALCHSELSEALEGLRKNLMDTHLQNRKMVEVELADTFIRLCDMTGALNLDLGKAIVEKDEYNHSRSDHIFENRMSENGKKF